MLEFLRGKASDRKLRLFAVACCWWIWQPLNDERSRRAVEIAERHADGLASEEELESVNYVPWVGSTEIGSHAAQVAKDAARGTGFSAVIKGGTRADLELAEAAERQRQSGFLRDLFGNLFRPANLDPSWLSWQAGTIPKLAQTIYDERAFDHLPILADALEEAGCTDPDILTHCRSGGDHVRGCWPVDLILGKS
jgi:hypothetical protein